jgi:hypothetical protein
VVAAVGLFLALAASPASAAYLHPENTEWFGSEGTESSPFGSPFGSTNTALRLNQASHRLFFVRPYRYLHQEPGSDYPPQIPRGIYAFDLSPPGAHTAVGGGFPIPLLDPTFGSFAAVDESEGRIYYVDVTLAKVTKGVLYGYAASGESLGGNFPVSLPNRVRDMAVDPEGYLWLLTDVPKEPENQFTSFIRTLEKYGPEGNLISSTPTEEANWLIGFDRFSGDLWVSRFGAIERLTAVSGFTESDRRFPAETPSEVAGQMALDATHGVIYVIPGYEGHVVNAYNETGDLLESFGAGGDYRGIAVDESTGTVYLNDNSDGGFQAESPGGDKVRVWPGAIVPDVTTAGPTAISHTTATLNGHFDPAGGPGVTSCNFEYSPDSAFNEVQEVSVAEATGGTYKLSTGGINYSENIPYNATLTEFQQALEAKWGVGNIVVTGSDGGPYTVELTGALAGENPGNFFVQPSLTPAAGHVNVVTKRNGTVEGWNSPSVAPCVPAASPGSPIGAATDVSAELTGLSTGVTYRYRLVAGNTIGSSTGSQQTVTPQPSLVTTGPATEVVQAGATLNGTVDPEELSTTFYFEYGRTTRYGKNSSPPPGVDVGTTEAGAKPVSAPIAGLTPATTYHYRIVAVNEKGKSVGPDRAFTSATAVRDLTTDPASVVTRTTATLNGTLDPAGLETFYYFEWGRTKRYGQTSATPPGAELEDTTPGDQHPSFIAEGLKPETTYHFRMVGSNTTFGTTKGADRTLTTPPAVTGVTTDPAEEIQPTSATLKGNLDPDGFQTTFYFEWGKTVNYGHTSPAPPGDDVGTIQVGQHEVGSSLEELEPGTTYHYRLVGVNQFGSTVGGDRSFSTPEAPSLEGVFSANVTADSADLEARINPNGLDPSFETTYRFEYGTNPSYGQVAPVPDGVIPPSTSGQPVTAPVSGLSRTTYHFRVIAENKWGSVASEDQTFDFTPPACPNEAVRQETGAAYLPDCRAYELVSPGRAAGAILIPQGPTSPAATDHMAFTGAVNVIPGTGEPPNADLSGDLYVATRTNNGWTTRYVGIPANETGGQGGSPDSEEGGTASMLTDLNLETFLTWRSPVQYFGGHGYGAPYVWDSAGNSLGRLPTNLEEVLGPYYYQDESSFVGSHRPSPDFSHYAFSSRDVAFAPGGLTGAPGSAYDNEIAAKTVTIVSRTASGGDIPQDASAGGSSEYIRIPAISKDGSHILMSTVAPGGKTHLYMRVDDAVSYDISLGEDMQNHGVAFAGMTEDGSAVYFTTAAQMTADDHDSSVDLYRWAENGGNPTLTRLSKGTEGSGDRDSCNSGWTTACGVEIPSDHPLASRAGDIYFYSPEELDGARGVPGKRNIYVWRAATEAVHHVATLESLGQASRINVSPDGAHMAFLTTTRLGAYENAGHSEMYSYDPASRHLVCVSCHPDGTPPSSNVQASQNGLFMADDGRAFFSTADALVPRDANGISDVYEYVDGRAQLITTGTGDDAGIKGREIGLVGVSGDGVDAFISTYQTLVPQDENGPFLKFYVARTNGGFTFNPPPTPCAAADECHGVSSSPPSAPQIGSGAELGGGGNLQPAAKPRHHAKKHKRHGRKRHHRHQQGANGR